MSSISSFFLEIELISSSHQEYFNTSNEIDLNSTKYEKDEVPSLKREENERILVFSAKSLKIYRTKAASKEENFETDKIALFIPSSITKCLREMNNLSITEEQQGKNLVSQENSCNEKKLSGDHIANFLTQKLHTALSNFEISCLIVESFSQNSAFHRETHDLLLLSTPKALNSSEVTELFETINIEGVYNSSGSFLRVLPISKVQVDQSILYCNKILSPENVSNQEIVQIPSCLVCLQRIDPKRLGLLSSKEITFDHNYSTEASENLADIDASSHYCSICKVISQYDSLEHSTSSSLNSSFLQWSNTSSSTHATLHSCYKCGMQETLWVCLICGLIGCGRYSGKHADKHYRDTGHAFTLELATRRIWDYAADGFAHHIEFLNDSHFNSSWNIPSLPAAAATSDNCTDCHISHSYSNDALSVKKTVMIGEEYEVLLQSALEDQAQHYESEITRLLAHLTCKNISKDSIMTSKEEATIQELQKDIANLHHQVNSLSESLVVTQAQEANYRGTCQQLLRDQGDLKEELASLQSEVAHEHQLRVEKMEELEQQISDLTTNLRMRNEILQHNHELSNGRIFAVPNVIKRKGKKKHRSKR